MNLHLNLFIFPTVFLFHKLTQSEMQVYCPWVRLLLRAFGNTHRPEVIHFSLCHKTTVSQWRLWTANTDSVCRLPLRSPTTMPIIRGAPSTLTATSASSLQVARRCRRQPTVWLGERRTHQLSLPPRPGSVAPPVAQAAGRLKEGGQGRLTERRLSSRSGGRV